MRVRSDRVPVGGGVQGGARLALGGLPPSTRKSDTRDMNVLRKTLAAFAATVMCAGFAPGADAHRLDRASAWLVSTARAQDSPAEIGHVAFCARVTDHRVDCPERYPNVDVETGDHCAVVFVLRLERSGRLSISADNCPTSEPPFSPARDVRVKPPGGLRFLPLTPASF